MEAKAIAKYVRVSPKKARLIMNQVRGKPAGEALKLLRFAKQKAAGHIRKTLESAIANAEHNFDMDVTTLFISDGRIDEGPSLRRLNMRARGMADIIRRPTCHITVKVSEREGLDNGKKTAKAEPKAAKAEPQVEKAEAEEVKSTKAEPKAAKAKKADAQAKAAKAESKAKASEPKAGKADQAKAKAETDAAESKKTEPKKKAEAKKKDGGDDGSES